MGTFFIYAANLHEILYRKQQVNTSSKHERYTRNGANILFTGSLYLTLAVDRGFKLRAR